MNSVSIYWEADTILRKEELTGYDWDRLNVFQFLIFWLLPYVAAVLCSCSSCHPHVCPLNPDIEKCIRLPLCIDVVACTPVGTASCETEMETSHFKTSGYLGKIF